MDINKTAEFLKNNDNFTILCHMNPDGDTLGSGYALCGVLQRIGKKARVVCGDKASERFDFIKEAIIKQDFSTVTDETETVVTVDIADVELLGSIKSSYEKRIVLCIDHHISNKNYAENTLLDVEAAACAEIIWELIKVLGKEHITPEIAAAIYTGISTDTGCFKYPNTTAKTHIITAELMGYDFDISALNYLMFDMKTRGRVALEQTALNTIEYYFNSTCAVIVITEDMIKDIDIEDANNVSALPRQIEGVEVGVVIKEKGENVWKASVRTSSKADAQAICLELGGGGHIRAAGCTLKGDINTVKNAILREVGAQLGVNK